MERGSRGSRPPTRRYQCSTRRHGGGCDQPQTKAEPLEGQLIDWLKDFRPDEELRAYVLAAPRGASRRSDDIAVRRRELIRQLNRRRDLYIMEDLSKSEYLVRRRAIEEQFERTGMPLDPRIDKAEEILAEFGQKFWDHETEAAERRRLVASLVGACGKTRATSWL